MDGGGELGIGAADDVSATEPARETAAERRRQRDSLFLTGQMALAGDAAAREVRVRNLSEGGLMIESERVVDPGTAVTLEVRGLGVITGQVAWCTQGRMGVALDRPIDPRRARKPVGNGTTTPVYAKPLIAKVPRR